MASVLVLSDDFCKDLPVPAHVTVKAVDGLTAGGLLTLLDRKPDLVQHRRYDVIFLHVGSHNISLAPTATTLVCLLDLLVLKVKSLSPSSHVVVSSLMTFPDLDSAAATLTSNTNKLLSQHFGKKAFVKSNFKLVKAGKARREMFVPDTHCLNTQGKQAVWSLLANFLRYLKGN